jgi:hypothetical protein
MMRLVASVAFCVLAACGGAAAGAHESFAATPVNGFRPEDRVLIGDFSRVNAIAATTDRVYVVYSTAVAVWRPIERRWDVPRSPIHPDALRFATRAVVDPLDRTLWIATVGSWLHYDPVSNRWDDGPFAVPPARLPRTSPTIEDAMRDLPQLRALAPTITLGPLMQQGVLTAAAPDPLGQGWFLGTSNRGLVFFDRVATAATPIPLGLQGDVVGSVATTPDGIWVATDADGRHPASLAHLATELDASDATLVPSARGMPFSASRRMLSTASALWIATDRGVVRAARNANGLDRFGTTNGLPDERVLALAEYRGIVVAGTMRGLAVISSDSGFRSIVPTFAEPVYSLLASADTLWVGTGRGLFASLPGSNELLMPEGFRLFTGAAVAIMGIGYVGDTLVAMTPSQLIWRNPTTGAWSEGQSLSATLGSLTEFAATPRGAWIGGARGAALVQPNVVGVRYLLTQDQLPGELTALAVRDHYLWIGTRAGLLRLLLSQ